MDAELTEKNAKHVYLVVKVVSLVMKVVAEGVRINTHKTYEFCIHTGQITDKKGQLTVRGV